MAKVGYGKFDIRTIEELKTLVVNGVEFQVKQYLPVNDKLALISEVLNNSIDENYSFANPVKIDILTHLNIVFYYTNINFTDRQKEDIPKLFDALNTSGFLAAVIDTIPEEEYQMILKGVDDTVKAYYTYRNSLLGILEQSAKEYSNLNLDATEISKKLGDRENIEFLQDVMNKLG